MTSWIIVAAFGWLCFLFALRMLLPMRAALKKIAFSGRNPGINSSVAFERIAQQVLYDTALIYDAPEGDEYEH